eukprot:4910-Prymnesium_polylepis.1
MVARLKAMRNQLSFRARQTAIAWFLEQAALAVDHGWHVLMHHARGGRGEPRPARRVWVSLGGGTSTCGGIAIERL